MTMQLTMLKAKLHQARITHCDLHYEGSITIDPDLMEAAGILPFEQVDIYNINNGARMRTYVIEGRRGSREFGLNGAAARKAVVGDRVIVCAYCSMAQEQARQHQPRIVLLNENNEIQNIKGALPAQAVVVDLG